MMEEATTDCISFAEMSLKHPSEKTTQTQKEMEARNTALQLENSSLPAIKISKSCVDLTGELGVGIFLSRIVFLQLGKQENEAYIVKRKRRTWIAKNRQEWWEDCRLSVKQVNRAIKILKTKNLIKTGVWRHSGAPTVHISLNCKVFFRRIQKYAPKQSSLNVS